MISLPSKVGTLTCSQPWQKGAACSAFAIWMRFLMQGSGKCAAIQFMAESKHSEIPFGNGEPVPKIELVLSTQYSVEIDPQAPIRSLKHLGRALFCEVFMTAVDDTQDLKSGVDATIGEISSIVDGLGVHEARAVLKVAFWAEVLKTSEIVAMRKLSNCITTAFGKMPNLQPNTSMWLSRCPWAHRKSNIMPESTNGLPEGVCCAV